MYAKLFSSIITSSLWTEDNSTKVLFITMLALADREGYVYGSVSGLARVACLEPEETKAAIETLSGPDPESSDLTRNPENSGRRIEAIDGGWRVLNYPYYRDLHDADERRHQDKIRKRKSRSVTRGHDPSRSVTQSPPSESESPSESTQSQPKTFSRRFAPPTREEVEAEFASRGRPDLAEGFWEWWGPDGLRWSGMKNWKMRVRSWIAKRPKKSSRTAEAEDRNLAYARVGRGD